METEPQSIPVDKSANFDTSKLAMPKSQVLSTPNMTTLVNVANF